MMLVWSFCELIGYRPEESGDRPQEGSVGVENGGKERSSDARIWKIWVFFRKRGYSHKYVMKRVFLGDKGDSY